MAPDLRFLRERMPRSFCFARKRRPETGHSDCIDYRMPVPKALMTCHLRQMQTAILKRIFAKKDEVRNESNETLT